MKINMNELLFGFSKGLDAVESDFLGASTWHGYRIAVLCLAMGRHLDFAKDELSTLASCALLHDNALTEYILSERSNSAKAYNMKKHCEIGQDNIGAVPFPVSGEGLILYHHERADGQGPFGKVEGEIPCGAFLIAIADMLDVQEHLQRCNTNDLTRIRKDISDERGRRFAAKAADAMLAVLDEEMLGSLKDERVKRTLMASMPERVIHVQGQELIDLAGFAAKIIDYKSQFTKDHSVQIANIAWHMAKYYGYDEETQSKIYFSGALHDIGKLFVPTEILEKPGRLTADEYEIIKSHITWTYNILSEISGFEEICEWAGNHHERLDGSGYNRGLSANDLDFNSRLLACIDFYQALSAKRPYHEPRSHAATIAMLRELGEKGQMDNKIIDDLDRNMAGYAAGEVPPPDGVLM